MFGEGGDDDLIGGYGNDWISGGTGQDGILGDDGRIFTSRNGLAESLFGIAATTQSFISTPGNAQQADLNVTGELKKSVDLTLFNPDPADYELFDSQQADDILYGGLGSDFMHGGAGDDAMSGAEALAAFYSNPTNAGNVLSYNPTTGEFAAYLEYSPRARIEGFLLNFAANEGPAVAGGTWGTVNTDGDDKMFGDLGNDWLVGGNGRDNLYGGWGDDLLNVDDDLGTNGGLNDGTDTHPSYEDRAFGGAGRDRLIANTGGDRLIDWAGEFNSYIVPFAPFGLATVSRSLQPQLAEFLYALSASDGADFTRALDEGTDPVRNGEPFGELGVVRQQDFAWRDQTGGPDDPQPGNIGGGPRDVLRSASFTDAANATEGFLADSGKWTVQNGVLQVSADSQGGDAVAVYNHGEQLPAYFEVQASIETIKPTGGWKANSYIVFDYISKLDFKFAGIDVATNKLEIGHRDASGWHVDKSTNVNVKADTFYNAMLAINGVNATILIDNKTSLTYTFAPRMVDGWAYGLNWGMVGMGSDNSRGAYDNVRIQVLPAQMTFDNTEKFGDATLDFFSGDTTGSWGVAGGRYTTTPGTSAGMSLLDLGPDNLSVDAVLDLSGKVNTMGRAGFVFDRYSADNFKFVAIDAPADKVIIGHYTAKSGWVNDLVVAKTINAATDYTLGMSLKGSTVSVTLDGQVVGGFAYNAVTVDGRFGLMASSGAASFDDVRAKTSDRALAPAAGAHLFADTVSLTSDSSDAELTQAQLDGAAVAAMEYWTQSLGNGDARLAGLGSFRISSADLAGPALGYTQGNHVYIDADAAGFGWSLTSGYADTRSMDLSTVVTHEIGHLLGFDDDSAGVAVMQGSLEAGVSRMLDTLGFHADADQPITDQALRDLAARAVRWEEAGGPRFDLGAGSGAGSGSGVDWSTCGAEGWGAAAPLYGADKVTKDARGNFSDYFVKLLGKGAETKTAASYDSLAGALGAKGKTKPKA